MKFLFKVLFSSYHIAGPRRRFRWVRAHHNSVLRVWCDGKRGRWAWVK